MSRRIVAFGIAAVVLLALVGGFFAFRSSGKTMHVKAEFTRLVGVYPGSSVRILGVPVGKVTKITPHGTAVTVEMTYDGKYKVPADATAAVVPPAIVGDRYIQLTPAYTGGPVMTNNQTLGCATATTDCKAPNQVPQELDQIFSNLDQLNQDLGPQGANSTGALSRLIAVGAKDLADGNAVRLNKALHDVSQLVGTLDNSSSDLVGIIDHLGQFTTMLALDDTNVRKVNQDLASVADFLVGERDDLSGAVRNLSIALGEIANLVKDNRTNLKIDVKALADVTNTLVRQKRNLTEYIDVAPLALSNLQNAFDETTQSLGTRGNFDLLSDPLKVLCNVFPVGPSRQLCKGLINVLPINGAMNGPSARKAADLAQLLGVAK
jgi:phospholipid/cholesterol/gamma-HCH transport system substrate-binding protein